MYSTVQYMQSSGHFKYSTSVLVRNLFSNQNSKSCGSMSYCSLYSVQSYQAHITYTRCSNSVKMSEEKKSLPFIYQFGAGAVAGVSEVCSFLNCVFSADNSVLHLDTGHVVDHRFNPRCNMLNG